MTAETNREKKNRNEYFKDYRQQNRDKLNAYNRAYRKAHQKQRAETMLKYWTKKLAETEAEEGENNE